AGAGAGRAGRRGGPGGARRAGQSARRRAVARGPAASRGRRTARAAACRGVSRSRAAARVRGRASGPRTPGSAWRALRAARTRDPRGHHSGLSQQRQDVPQRLLALEGATVRPRTLLGGRVARGAVRPSRYRARVLRHPLAHERVHPGVQPPVLRRDRRRWPLRTRACAARRLPAGHLARRHRARDARRPGASRRGDDGGGGPAMRRVFGSLSSRIFLAATLLAWLSIAAALLFVNARLVRESDAALEQRLVDTTALVQQQRQALLDTFRRMALLVADLPKLKAAMATNDPPTVAPVAAQYAADLNADLLVVLDGQGEILGSAGAAAPAAAP